MQEANTNINENAKWYVVHTYSGYENKVKANIEKTVENRQLEEQILEVAVPMEEVEETKNNVMRIVQKKIFPGYVLVHMVMNDETWYVVRNTRGVTGFVGPGSKPVPLTDAEIRSLGLGGEGDGGESVMRQVVDYEAGDVVKVIAGPWKDMEAVITDINIQKRTATISVEIFGRATPVEIGFSDFRKKD